MRHQQRRNPEGGDPVGWAHICRCAIDGCQCNCRDQIYASFHVEDPYEKAATSEILRHRQNRRQREHGRQQVAERRRICKLRRDTGVGGSWRQEHQSEVPK